MVATEKVARGRKRAFDVEAALDLGQRLFHAGGYDAVGVAALVEAIEINPPSFYAAFGSKSAFFDRIAERYAASVLRAEDILLPARSAREALGDLLRRAARVYVQDPDQRGCLVLEAARGDAAGGEIAKRLALRRHEEIRAFVARTHPDQAHAAADYMVTVMSGLSASARQGLDGARLSAVAQAAERGLAALLDDRSDRA